MSGSVSFYAGLAAEECVLTEYQRQGWTSRASRWRGKSGEIDLILEKSGGLVFVEVKKSRDFARAAEALSARQMARIMKAAAEFLATMPNGQDTDCRFDVALVNGSGQIKLVENAFGH